MQSVMLIANDVVHKLVKMYETEEGALTARADFSRAAVPKYLGELLEVLGESGWRSSNGLSTMIPHHPKGQNATLIEQIQDVVYQAILAEVTQRWAEVQYGLKRKQERDR
jgi:hypothetical protein